MTSSNAFAVNPDYLIGTGSNSIMTLDLDDYGVSVASSIASVSSSIDISNVAYNIRSGNTVLDRGYLDSDGRISYSVPSGQTVDRIVLFVYAPDQPSAGTYRTRVDFSSTTSIEYSYVMNSFRYYKDNVEAEVVSTGSLMPYFTQSSGDFLLDYNLELKSKLSYIAFSFSFDPVAAGGVIDGYFSINFSFTSESADIVSPGSGSSTSDYQDDVSSSLSDISSSIGDMSSSLDSAAENLEYISTSQNLIIEGIDNVILHISDQLYAFWDQLYNLIHEPTYARLGEILDAIRNLDLEITVEMTEVTNAINKLNTDMQTKLQNVQQTITQGFDSTVMESEASKLEDSISEYDEAEQSVIQNVNDSLNDFEFDAELGEYQSIVSTVSDFLQQLYESSGGFKILINLSMLLSLAGIVIGIYRFGGGA